MTNLFDLLLERIDKIPSPRSCRKR